MGFRVVISGPVDKAEADRNPGSKPNPETRITATQEPVPPPEKPADTPPEPEPSDLLSIPGLKTRLDGYLTTQGTQVGNLANSYLKGLESRLEKAADAGDLKLVESFREEKARVQELQQSLASHPADLVAGVAESATLPPLPDGAPGDLATLRNVWTSERQKIRGTLDVALQQSLTALEQQLTRDRDFENAKKVLGFRESLASGGPAESPTTEVAASPPKSSPKAAPPVAVSASPARATKDEPFENGLGMRFVPVPIRGGPTDEKTVLFSIWETRVGDYAAFIEENKGRPWKKHGFEQSDDHPALVNWHDAHAFCEWLTEAERAAGKLGDDEHYRLPSDHEWSCAVGIGRDEDAEESPEAKEKIAYIYPWGKKFPPPKGAGNFLAESIEGYDDGFEWTAPVGSFEANEFGLHDLGGNALEWCVDWYMPERKTQRVLRGSAWSHGNELTLRSSRRTPLDPKANRSYEGFRIVLAPGAGDESTGPGLAPVPKPTPGNTATSIASATEARPFENSLGMRFVPVPITGGPSDGHPVLFSIWETRVKDYAAFIKAHPERQWSEPDFPQEDDHPAVMVSWDDAQAFCKWLTEEERKKGKLGNDEHYRLPTDHEWSCAVGIGRDEDADLLPDAKNSIIENVYPWGKDFPPPRRSGNYLGEETKENPGPGIKGYEDGFSQTAPVGSFRVNKNGLYDMGGNAVEWCEDWYSTDQKNRVARGGAWFNRHEVNFRSSRRHGYSAGHRNNGHGIRVVLAAGTGETQE
jgi:formylglycine-generating enzyme required for sulfatase activity